jgi:hypothetical protein
MFTPLLKDLHGSIGIVSLNRVWDLNGFDNRSDNAMSGNNQQKTILVTGCSSGIGAYCARALKVEGWHVIASARTEEDLATLRNDGIEAYRLDYAEPESIASFFEKPWLPQADGATRCSTMAVMARSGLSRTCRLKRFAPSSRQISSAGMISQGGWSP